MKLKELGHPNYFSGVKELQLTSSKVNLQSEVEKKKIELSDWTKSITEIEERTPLMLLYSPAERRELIDLCRNVPIKYSSINHYLRKINRTYNFSTQDIDDFIRTSHGNFNDRGVLGRTLMAR